MVRLARARPKCSYEQLVADHGDETSATPHLYIRRTPGVPHARLIVTVSTHNEGDRYAGLVESYRHLDADLLFIRDPDNSYYLQGDGGAAFDGLVARIVSDYRPEQLLFFGSSMGGAVALRHALTFNGNALLSNPQVSLSATAPLAWTELRRNIERIAAPRDLGDADFQARECAITLLHSRHLMDQENMRLFFDLYRRHPGLALLTVHADEDDHKYLVPDFRTFLLLIRRTFELRALRGKIVDWGRVPKRR